MTNKERVLAAVHFEEKDFTPYDMTFTSQFRDSFERYLKEQNISTELNQHITSAHLNMPQTPVSGKDEFFSDEFGVIWNRTGVDKDIGVIDNIQISCEEDLDSYTFPSPDEAFIRGKMDELIASSNDNFKAGALGFSLFERAWTLMGMEDLLCNMLAEPEFIHRLMRKICDYNLKVLEIALPYEFDGFYFGDDWGQQIGLIMGPECWRTFIKPYLSEMYAKIKESGKLVIQHSCGDIREIMDDLIEIGLNIYQTFQPEIYSLDYSQKLLGKLSIWGGISVQADLPYKTPDEIKQITINTLKAFKKGGLIAAPTHSVPNDVPPENILAMAEVFHNQEKYIN